MNGCDSQDTLCDVWLEFGKSPGNMNFKTLQMTSFGSVEKVAMIESVGKGHVYILEDRKTVRQGKADNVETVSNSNPVFDADVHTLSSYVGKMFQRCALQTLAMAQEDIQGIRYPWRLAMSADRSHSGQTMKPSRVCSLSQKLFMRLHSLLGKRRHVFPFLILP